MAILTERGKRAIEVIKELKNIPFDIIINKADEYNIVKLMYSFQLLT